MDPRIAYMMTNLMEEVLRTGTGAGVRSRGFALPAAGKTGTSHDGWFAGFTTELICVVWVGYDDNRELDLEGARSALPIWAEFMKRAHRYRPYRQATAFKPADGVLAVEVDPNSGKLAAGNACGAAPRVEVFLAGTQPLEACDGARTQVASWDAPASQEEPAQTNQQDRDQPRRVASRRVDSIPVTPREPNQPQPEEKKKRGFFGRIMDVFK
jgi:penicillin-binding protein 1B